MKTFIFLLLILIGTRSFAQITEDVVYLKDGSIYKGEILENVINDIIKIKTHDDNVKVLKYDGILAFKKEPLVRSENKYSAVLTDTGKYKWFSPIIGCEFLVGAGSPKYSRGIGISSALLLNLTDRFSIGASMGYVNMLGLTEQLTPNFNEYPYYQTNVETNDNKNYGYYSFGVINKLYLTLQKAIRQYIVVQYSYAMVQNSNVKLIAKFTDEYSYVNYQYTGNVPTVQYNYLSENSYSLKYSTSGNIISFGYGLESKSSKRYSPFIQFSFNILKTNYEYTTQVRSNYTNGAPPDNHELPNYSRVEKRNLIIDTFNFKTGIKF